MAQQGPFFGCPYRSGVAAWWLFMFLRLVPAADSFTQRRQAKNIIGFGVAAVATVVNRLMTEKR